MSFISFEMLIFEVVSGVAARERFRGLVVVLDVIGAQPLPGVMDVDVIVGDEEIALAPLRALGGKFCDATLGTWRADLLRGG
jgi:hypothetical protein